LVHAAPSLQLALGPARSVTKAQDQSTDRVEAELGRVILRDLVI
jgi:hypothetical protein